MSQQSKLLTTFEVDDPVALTQKYRMDANDRRYLDNQIRALQMAVLGGILQGRVATRCLITEDAARGDVVTIDTATTAAQRLVKRALAASLAATGAPLGVLLADVKANTFAQVAITGLVEADVTGLGVGGQYLVKVNTTTGRLERVTGTLEATDYPIGSCDTQGNVTLYGAIQSGGSGGIGSNEELNVIDFGIGSGWGDGANVDDTHGTETRGVVSLTSGSSGFNASALTWTCTFHNALSQNPVVFVQRNDTLNPPLPALVPTVYSATPTGFTVVCGDGSVNPTANFGYVFSYLVIP